MIMVQREKKFGRVLLPGIHLHIPGFHIDVPVPVYTPLDPPLPAMVNAEYFSIRFKSGTAFLQMKIIVNQAAALEYLINGHQSLTAVILYLKDRTGFIFTDFPYISPHLLFRKLHPFRLLSIIAFHPERFP